MNREHAQTIDAPHLMSRGERARDAVFTGVMWVLYAYLWLPAVSLFAWLLGINFAYDVMVRAGGAETLLRVLNWYGFGLLLIICAVALWSATERLRFRGRERRQAIAALNDEALLGAFAIGADQLRLLRRGQRLQLDIDADGQLRGIRQAKQEPRSA